MTTTNDCVCSGAVCTCGAEGVVKDGAGVRVSALTMDAAPPIQDARADAYGGMVAHLNDAWRSPAAAPAASPATEAVHAQALADAKAAGATDADARFHADRQAQKHSLSTAWQR